MNWSSSVYKYILMDCAQKGWYPANFSFGDHFMPNIYIENVTNSLCVFFGLLLFCLFDLLGTFPAIDNWKNKTGHVYKKVISLCKWRQFCLTCTNLKWGLIHLLLHDMGELFEVCDFIVDFVLWVHVVSKEQATHIIVHHLARLGQVTQNLVNALLEMVLQLLPHDVEECHSVLKKRNSC